MKTKFPLEQRYAINIASIAFALLLAMFALQVYQLKHTAAQIATKSELSFNEEAERQLLQRGVVMTETLSHNLVAPYLAMDMLGLYDLMVPVHRSSSVRSVFFFDTEGRILHDGTREIATFEQDVRSMFSGISPSSGASEEMVLESSIVVVRPVRSERELLGGIVIELSTEANDDSLARLDEQLNTLTDRSVRSSIVELGAIGLFLVVCLSLGAMLVGRRLAEPVMRLSSLAERLGEGDYDARVGFERDDEIGDLAKSFDQMRRSLKEQNKRIEFQAYYDELTGLQNRAAFQQLMSNVFVNSAVGVKHVLVYIDIDDFKRVNDALGHGAGDRLLKSFSSRLKAWSEDMTKQQPGVLECTAARWGGDQFVVLMRGVENTSVVSPLVRDLLNNLSMRSDLAGMDVVLSSSVGYAVFPDDAYDSDTLMSYADLAMFTSKERGTNLVSAYSKRTDGRKRLNLVLESEIRRAMAEKQFELKYVPIADTTSRVVTSMEQMVVWNHQERGVLKPKHFMAALVSAGLREEFRAWGFNQGLDDLVTWKNAGHTKIKLAYNLATIDFDPKWLSDLIMEGLERTEVDSRDIAFEVNESSFSKNMVLTAELLRDLGLYDISLWIDSFGTGYTSLNRLRRMPVSGIKIHHSVVSGVNTSLDNQHLVAASIAMAHGLGFLASADGVMDEGQLSFLRQKGCDSVQGPIVSDPLSADKVVGFLNGYPGSPRLKITS
ncbi:MAG: putative bifunctional diguanylate cyclase/phosphodiesterase [Gammaproteobacteria bacterium]